VKLRATCSPFEALPPVVWAAVKIAIVEAGRSYGMDIALDDDLTVLEAHQRFWQLHRVQENARLAAETTDG
jgi:hypothetical protein